MRITVAFLLFLFIGFQSFAQDADLFGSNKPEARKGFVLGVNGNFDIPGADMAKRFGISYRIGGSVHYKTKNNWIFGPKVDFILGSKIVEDSFLVNIKDRYGSFINQEGRRVNVRLFERGYMIGLEVGKILNLSNLNNDNGILIMTGAGFMQHKINIFERDQTIAQLRGDYKKGYDRLSNGFYLEQYLGYSFFSNSSLINFHLGLDITAGFTKGRRDYLYDVMRTDNQGRVDLLFGIRGGWYLPIFKKKSEDIFFE